MIHINLKTSANEIIKGIDLNNRINPITGKPMLSAIDKCDAVLMFLYSPYDRIQPYGRIEECFVYDYEDTNKNADYSPVILQHILSHLEHEGYIYKDEHKFEYTSPKAFGRKIIEDFAWALSIPGEVFISRGGYKGQNQRDYSEKKRADRNENLLAGGTLILAVLTGGLLFFEFVKFLIDYYL